MRDRHFDARMTFETERTFLAQSIAVLSALGFSKEDIAYITAPDDSDEWNVLSIDFLLLPVDFNRAKTGEPEPFSENIPEIPYSPEAMLSEVFRIARQRSKAN